MRAIAHRGPDGQGTWVDPGGQVAFGHVRLAIVDLSPTGAQPMTSADGRWVLTFNGEVYGHRELRRRLEGLGCRFRGTSDTEVLVEAIARWGLVEALEQVNGMYALGAWDTVDRALWLARDPVGEKPLYVWDAPGEVAFSSELGGLRALEGFAGELDPDAVATYLQLGHVPAPLSIYRSVSKLQPGEWRRYDAARPGSPTSGRIVPGPADGATADDLFDLLVDAVALRTIADVPVGVFLSGGIDSTIVAALAARAGTTHTFTATFGRASHDESVHAEQVAQALGTVHAALPVDAADGLALARDLPRIYGEPFGDPSAIPTLLIAAEAKRSVGVALTGDGGDELFGGYNRLVAGARLDRLRARLPGPAGAGSGAAVDLVGPRRVERLATTAARRVGRPPIPNLADKLTKAAAVLGSSATPEAILALVAMWADPSALGVGGTPLHLGMGSGTFGDELLALDRRWTLPEQMLTKVDRATMHVALEARPPLLDHRVVALARRAAFADHVQDGVGKQLLRALVPRLIDPALLDRPKMGFDPPFGSWLRGPLRGWADQLLAPDALAASGITRPEAVTAAWQDHLAGASGLDAKLWTVLQFQQWHESEHLRRPPSEPVAPRVRLRSKGLEVRPARPDDGPAVVRLLAASMQSDPDDERFAWLLRWKHERNPFGPSPAWVATSGDELVGYRPFLRWRFVGRGRSWDAVRAVDTATHPDHQGKGTFSALTLHGLDELRLAGVDFVFNTPNDQSRPGYLKMGWQLVDRVQPWVRPAGVSALARIARSRTLAGIWGEPFDAGAPAAEAFADDAATAALLAASRPVDDDRFRTARSPEYLRWRYPEEHLGYRVLTLGRDLAEGAACVRLRRRGEALEATVGDLLVPGGDPAARRALVRLVVDRTGADYALLVGAGARDLALPLPGQGPTLVWRHVNATEAPPAEAWDWSMGDLELF